MPLCTIHLVALHPTTPQPLQTFLTTLRRSNLSPLVISRVIRWIIFPSTLSTEHLIARNIRWDLLLVLPGSSPLPASLTDSLVQHHWSITAGVPSRLIQDFETKNAKMLKPAPGSVPKITGALEASPTTSSAQDLELSADLRVWIRDFYNSGSAEAQGAVSMFNLLSFAPGMKASYLEYGKAFAARIGSSHGGNAKIVGGVTATEGVQRDAEKGDGQGWDEVALAHYPSVVHFAEMLVDEEYQKVNKKYRVPALKDTAILMTSEVGIAEMMGAGKGKL